MESDRKFMFNELESQDIKYKTLKHVPIKTIQDICETIQLPPEVLVKVLVFSLDKPDKYLIAAIRGNDKLDWRKLAQAVSLPRKKINLLNSDTLVNLMGPLGSLKPFGYDDRFSTIFDRKLVGNEAVVCSAGTPTESLFIRSKDLIKISHAQIASFSKPSKANIS